jgi:hypothetical protein
VRQPDVATPGVRLLLANGAATLFPAMSPEWIPLLFVSAVIALLLFMLRPREQSFRHTFWRIAIVEVTYVGMAYLLFKVLEHPPVEALFGASMCALIAGVAVPKRLYRKLSGEK